jgi:hypothetical protein
MPAVPGIQKVVRNASSRLHAVASPRPIVGVDIPLRIELEDRPLARYGCGGGVECKLQSGLYPGWCWHSGECREYQSHGARVVCDPACRHRDRSNAGIGSRRMVGLRPRNSRGWLMMSRMERHNICATGDCRYCITRQRPDVGRWVARRHLLEGRKRSGRSRPNFLQGSDGEVSHILNPAPAGAE